MNKRRTKENFFEELFEKFPEHRDRYDFSRFVFTRMCDKSLIHCNKCGNNFEMSPRGLLDGHNCPKCKAIMLGELYRKTKEDVIAEATKVHNGKYTYNHMKEYVNGKVPMIITCPIHGDFQMLPINHIHGKQGCPLCCNNRVKTLDEFIDNAISVHGKDRYDYSFIKEYINRETEVPIKCNKCGRVFYQKPCKHVNAKQGCPYCNKSKLEEEIDRMLTENNIEHEYQKHFNWLGRMSFDFYLPKYNIAVECQGIQHFIQTNFKGALDEMVAKQKFEELLKRDDEKYCLSTENNVKLLYYTEEKFKENIPQFYSDKEMFFNSVELIDFLRNDETSG